jgi:hypothetical protein
MLGAFASRNPRRAAMNYRLHQLNAIHIGRHFRMERGVAGSVDALDHAVLRTPDGCADRPMPHRTVE